VARHERPLMVKDPVARFAHGLRQLRSAAGGTPYRELAASAHYSPTSLSEAANGRRLPTLSVTLAYVRACGGDLEEWRVRWRATAAELNVAPGGGRVGGVPAGDSGGGRVNGGAAPQSGAPAGGGSREPRRAERAPYPGLVAFGVADADRFFGREDLLDLLLGKLAAYRFVAVVGASGSGKSSLLHAGLVPAVTAGTISPDTTWLTVVCTPGERPVHRLAGVLAELTARVGTADEAPAEQAPAEETDGERCRRLLAAVAGSGAAARRVLLVVDQFEEIFTLCRDDPQRAELVDLLLTAADEASGVYVVLGVRADFYGRCSEHPALASVLPGRQVLIGPMSEA
jgi:Novel STAND NTPase 1/Helix-turn-helix domain